ncbi:MAG: hypothetical protein JRN52_03885 [Nitrososphaerota archaeon]|nr:hypothetical protein [Nitrososphaerota archaeon]
MKRSGKRLRSKIGITSGIILIAVGLVVAVSNLFNTYWCSCAAQISGQPVSCPCYPDITFYFPLMFGSVIIALGLFIVVYFFEIQM